MELLPINCKLEDFKKGDRGIEFYFLDNGSLAEVKLSHDKYVDGEWVKDDEALKKYHENILQYLGVTEKDLKSILGESFNIYKHPDGYYTFWKPTVYKMFSKEEANKVLKGRIYGFQEYATKGVLIIEHKGELYKKNYNWSKYMPNLQKSYPSEGLKLKKQEEFQKCFKTNWSDRNSLIGLDILFEVKKNNVDKTGKYPTYLEIKNVD